MNEADCNKISVALIKKTDAYKNLPSTIGKSKMKKRKLCDTIVAFTKKGKTKSEKAQQKKIDSFKRRLPKKKIDSINISKTEFDNFENIWNRMNIYERDSMHKKIKNNATNRNKLKYNKMVRMYHEKYRLQPKKLY